MDNKIDYADVGNFFKISENRKAELLEQKKLLEAELKEIKNNEKQVFSILETAMDKDNIEKVVLDNEFITFFDKEIKVESIIETLKKILSEEEYKAMIQSVQNVKITFNKIKLEKFLKENLGYNKNQIDQIKNESSGNRVLKLKKIK